MDISTVGGLAIGFALIFVTILLGGNLLGFVNIPSVIVTIGGAVAATLINFPLEKMINAISVAQKAMFHKAPNPKDVISQIVEFATTARKEGVLALEGAIETIEDPFIKRGVQMIVDGTPPELTRSILEFDVSGLEDRHKEGQDIFNALGMYAPAFGMIGTLIGLVQMLQNMEDPSSIGAGMAVALLTTLYGAIVANLVCLPIAGKLKVRSQEEVLIRTIVIEGIQAIQSGDAPRIVEEKLKVFLPPKVRASMQA